MGIAATLSLAAQALKAQQAAIQTAGNNVANAATPGYSRQRVVLQTAAPSFENGIFLGHGVDATLVRSVVDHFSEAQLLDVHGDLGFNVAQQKGLSATEEVFPTTGGIDAALSDFFGALSDLANNPSDSAARTTVIGKANALGSSFQRTREQLSAIQSNLDQELQADAHQVSVLTRQIADLNQQVTVSEANGQPANDARDQRQIKLQDLARLTGVAVHENSDGQVTILAGNLLLVSGNRAASLDATTVSANGQHLLQIESPDGLKFDASGLFQSGEVGALLQQRDQGVAGSISQLDTLAKALVDQVNTQHAAGFDYNGNAGGSFFQPVATVAGAAALVQVTSGVAADPKLIATAQTANGAPGDNRNALMLVNLRDNAIVALGNTTVSGYFLSFLGSLGEEAQASQNNVDFQNQLLTQVQARRDGTSGVSVDEEMTNLILFQRAFEASSRLVTTSNELYQTLIDMTR